jgi:hypothetical protein
VGYAPRTVAAQLLEMETEMKCPFEQMAADEKREWECFLKLRKWSLDNDPIWMRIVNNAFAVLDADGYEDVNINAIFETLRTKWRRPS